MALLNTAKERGPGSATRGFTGVLPFTSTRVKCDRVLSRGEAFGVFDRLHQAGRIRDALAGYIKCRPVIDRRPDDRQSKRDIDAGQRVPAASGGIDLEPKQLDRDVALIVIVRDDRVVLTSPKFDKDRVARDRADHVQTVRD